MIENLSWLSQVGVVVIAIAAVLKVISLIGGIPSGPPVIINRTRNLNREED